ncbi:MAG: helix-turn-helix domain-containing protein [Acidimicrobiales bacterium]
MADFFSPDELAEYLGVPVSSIYGWRHKGTGPAGIRVGRHVRYRAPASTWITEQARRRRPDRLTPDAHRPAPGATGRAGRRKDAP